MTDKTTKPLLGGTQPSGLPLVGAQLSTAGGWSHVCPRALEVGAEAVQIFSSNPRIWPVAPPDIEGLNGLSAALRDYGLPLFMHSIYLINPASPDEGLRHRSIAALAHALVSAALAGAAGVVTHLGSHRGEGFTGAVPWILKALVAARTRAEGDVAAMCAAGHEDMSSLHVPPLLLETGAGSGATVGGTLEELEVLLASPALRADETGPHYGLCLDTAHMFAAGYALHEADGLTRVVDELRQRRLLERLLLVHLNDSASAFSSKRDRHANPGEGELTHPGLARVVRHPAFKHVPFVLEVPGSQGRGPGRAELDAVKTMRQEAAARRQPPAQRGRGPTKP